MDFRLPFYAVTIHKAQGSEFPAVVIPLATQHYMLLQRNLIYTGITRGKRLVVLVGQKKALGIAVHNDRQQRRYSGLLASLKGDMPGVAAGVAPIEDRQPTEGGIGAPRETSDDIDGELKCVDDAMRRSPDRKASQPRR